MTLRSSLLVTATSARCELMYIWKSSVMAFLRTRFVTFCKDSGASSKLEDAFYRFQLKLFVV